MNIAKVFNSSFFIEYLRRLLLYFFKSNETAILQRCSMKFFFKLGFTPCKAEQPLQGMELQEKETHKD